MPEVNGRTLMMAIQAVEIELLRLDIEITAAGEDADPDSEELALCYSNAAHDLERAYREACAEFSNLTPYEELVAPFARLGRPPKDPDPS